MRKLYTLGLCMLALMLVSVVVQGQGPDPVAHYKFNETEGTVVADASGNGNDAEVNCDTCWKEGTIGGALEFHGDTKVTIPADDLGMASTIGSVAFWVKMAAGELDQINTIYWAGDNETGGGFGAENELHLHVEKTEPDIWQGGEFGMWVLADPNVHVFSDPDKGTSAGVPPVNPFIVNDGEWHHIAATWGDGSVSIYFDGALVMASESYSATHWDITHSVIGMMISEGRSFTGMLDDFRIYDVALIDLDVDDLYNVDYTHVGTLESNAALSIYPNPATDRSMLRFDARAGQQVSVKLYSVTGALAGTAYAGMSLSGANEVELNTGDYATGIYMLELKVGSETTYSKLLIK